MTIRPFAIEDYAAVYALWMSCKNMGFNDLDDSRAGIARFLRRNPATSFVAEDDGRLVGVIDLRHHIDHPILGEWGGHCGYTVRPSERGRGYGREMLRLDLDKARALGLKRLLVTCDAANPASEKVILANGGVFERLAAVEGAEVKRYWIEL